MTPEIATRSMSPEHGGDCAHTFCVDNRCARCGAVVLPRTLTTSFLAANVAIWNWLSRICKRYARRVMGERPTKTDDGENERAYRTLNVTGAIPLMWSDAVMIEACDEGVVFTYYDPTEAL